MFTKFSTKLNYRMPSIPYYSYKPIAYSPSNQITNPFPKMYSTYTDGEKNYLTSRYRFAFDYQAREVTTAFRGQLLVGSVITLIGLQFPYSSVPLIGFGGMIWSYTSGIIKLKETTPSMTPVEISEQQKGLIPEHQSILCHSGERYLQALKVAVGIPHLTIPLFMFGFLPPQAIFQTLLISFFSVYGQVKMLTKTKNEGDFNETKVAIGGMFASSAAFLSGYLLLQTGINIKILSYELPSWIQICLEDPSMYFGLTAIYNMESVIALKGLLNKKKIRAAFFDTLRISSTYLEVWSGLMFWMVVIKFVSAYVEKE